MERYQTSQQEVISSDVLQLSPPKKLSVHRKPQKLQPVPSDYESDYEPDILTQF